MAFKKVGALWAKQDRRKKEYLSGTLDLGVLGEMPIMIFPNIKEGKGEKEPDFIVHLVTGQKGEGTKAHEEQTG